MRAVICGAGIAGLATAERLVHQGWEVVVLEAAPGPRTQGYMIDFFGAGYQAAERTGVLPRLQQLGYHVREVRYVDRAGRRRAGMYQRHYTSALNGQLVSLMRPDLEAALRERVEDRVELRYGRTLTHLADTDGGVRVRTADGSELEADLLIGADGIHSVVRRLLFGPEERFIRYLGLHTSAFIADAPAVRRQLGDAFVMTDSIDRMVGLYGLRDGRVAAFTVHRAPGREPPSDVVAALRDSYADLGWLVPEMLAQCPPADQVYYDEVSQVEVPSWHRGRVALVGDACQAVSLLAGQGASLAVAGAYLLGELLREAGPGAGVGEALTSYERMWRPVVRAKQRSGRDGIEWFLPSSRSRILLRRLALALTGLPGVDQRIGKALVGTDTVALDELARQGVSSPRATPV